MNLRLQSSNRGGLPRVGAAAFSLVEVVLALGIMTFGIIAIFGLLPTGLVSVQDGKMEEAGSDILALAAADLRAASPTGGESLLFKLNARGVPPVAATRNLDFVGGEVSNPEQAIFRLVASQRLSANPDLIIWHLTVEWPPAAAVPANRVETVTMIKR